MPGPDTSGLKPLSNADDMSLSNHGSSELSRIMSRAGIALANGFPLDDDEGDEEVDEDYVAVDQDDANDMPYWFRRPPTHRRTKLDELHPFVQLLSVSNVDDCVEVENAFPEQERCSRDKVRSPPQCCHRHKQGRPRLGCECFTFDCRPRSLPLLPRLRPC